MARDDLYNRCHFIKVRPGLEQERGVTALSRCMRGCYDLMNIAGSGPAACEIALPGGVPFDTHQGWGARVFSRAVLRGVPMSYLSCVPLPAVEMLALHPDIPVMRISRVIDFFSFLQRAPGDEFDILFSDSITDHMPGSRELLQLQTPHCLASPETGGVYFPGTNTRCAPLKW